MRLYSSSLVLAVFLAIGCAGGGDNESVDARAGGDGGNTNGGQCDFCADSDECCGGFCIDTSSNKLHCGQCDRACDEARADTCSGGQCTCNSGSACGEESTCCPGIGCKNLQTDAQSCGQCGNACGDNQSCVDGMCVCAATDEACESGTTCCADGCVNILNDDDNCGECGNTCTASETCTSAQCLCAEQCPNSPLPGCCDDGCFDLCSDVENCGACGNACEESCSLGACDGGPDIKFECFTFP